METLRQAYNCDGLGSVGVVFENADITAAGHGSSQAEEGFHFHSQLQAALSSDSLT